MQEKITNEISIFQSLLQFSRLCHEFLFRNDLTDINNPGYPLLLILLNVFIRLLNAKSHQFSSKLQ